MMEPESSSWWLYLLGAGGGVTIAGQVLQTFRDHLSGRAKAKSEMDLSLIAQRDHAIKQTRIAERNADVARARSECNARNARLLGDALARARRILVETGQSLEPWPVLENCDMQDDRGEDDGT